MISSDNESTLPAQTNTSGGAAVGGDVNTGGDFVGRDQISGAGDIHIHNYPAQPPPSTTPESEATPAPGPSPYQGMEYFDIADADRFFGREQLTAELVEHLRHSPLLAVVGASGSGKSSLVRAGLIPALQETKPLLDGSQPPKGSGHWAYHVITPTSRPVESLAASLTRHSESVTATSTLIDDLRRDERSLHLAARRLVSSDQRLLLVIDQLEELFTLCKDRSERQAFVENLLHAAQTDGVVTLVVTLRADFYHHCAEFPAVRTALETQQKYIGTMSRDDLRRAIEQPALLGQWELQAGLVDQLLADVGNEPGALPLLSHALLATWQRRSGRTLTLAGYRSTGGVQGAIAKTADDIYRSFSTQQQAIARTLFLRLTELGEGAQDTRRRVRPDELKLTHARADEVQQVLNTLAGARLVTTATDEVQVAHEALIRYWGTLRTWLDEDREGQRIQRRLTEAANEWVEFEKEPALLYRGVLLQQAQEWRQFTIDPPNQRESEFLDLSLAEAEAAAKRAADLAAEREATRQRELENQHQLTAEQSRRARIFRNGVIVAGLLFLLAAGAAGFSYYLNWQLTRKNQDLDQANTQLNTSLAESQRLAKIALSRQLAAQSTNELNNHHYEPAVLLAIESGQLTDTLESFVAIRSAIANPWHSRTVIYMNIVSSVSWSHNESRILIASEDKTVRIWDVTSSKELSRLEGHTRAVWEAIWSQDESRILTASEDMTARIWDATNCEELVKFEGHTDSVTQAIWSQDESRILTASRDGTVRIWDVTNGEELVKLEGHVDSITQAIWSQDESRILTASEDTTARIWDATNGEELVKLEGHTEAVWEAIWNQSESRILTASRDGTVRIWDATSGEELVKLEGHRSDIWNATWSQDENRILTSSYDKTVRIWDATNGEELVKLEGHTDSVSQAIWNQDESRILTYSKDTTVRIWDAISGEELIKLDEHSSWVNQAIWSQDESQILTAGSNGIVRIWDIDSGVELVKFQGHTDDVFHASWSQDESKILTSSYDNTTRIWDAASGKELVKLEGPTISVHPSWSKDERRIFGAGHYTVNTWDAALGVELVKFEVHRAGVNQASWSHDENRILTSGYDRTARVWDAVSGKELVKLEGHIGDVNEAKWNKDESRILTASDDHTARIWDAASGVELVKFEGHRSWVNRASWNQDESRILTASDDNTARIWDAASGVELVKLEGHTGSVRQAIWNQDEDRILSSSFNPDNTVRVWDALSGIELVKLEGHRSAINQVMWNQNESRILSASDDNTARIWDAVSGVELVKLEGHTGEVYQAIWNQSESKILTSSADGTARIWYAHMDDLLIAACTWVPRNFTWTEWGIYMKDIEDMYRPTCPHSPIPRDVIYGIQDEVSLQIRAGQVITATKRLEQLNGWLQVNGQFKQYGVDVPAFVAAVAATATAEALPTPVTTPEPTATPRPTATQPPSPLAGWVVSPLATPTTP